jgi:hypothetical protein
VRERERRGRVVLIIVDVFAWMAVRKERGKTIKKRRKPKAK